MARITFFVFLIVTACTIIEDSDITSREELANLKLISIDVVQETASGASTLVGTVTTDEEVNIPLPGNEGVITRVVWMEWPSFGNKKLKLKGGYTGAIRTYTSYLSNGSPYTFRIHDKDTTELLELYRFRYNPAGKLINIITNVPFVDGGPATSRDTLIYNNPNHPSEFILVRNPNSGDAKPFTMETGSINNAGFTFDFQGMNYGKSCEGNGCGAHWGGDYWVSPNNEGPPTGVMDMIISQGEYFIQDRNKDISTRYCNNNPCHQGTDTYYFHPLMLLQDRFEFGDALLFFYSVDWWQPISAQESQTDEKVTFSFKYDL